MHEEWITDHFDTQFGYLNPQGSPQSGKNHFWGKMLSSATTWPQALHITTVVLSFLCTFRWHIQFLSKKFHPKHFVSDLSIYLKIIIKMTPINIEINSPKFSQCLIRKFKTILTRFFDWPFHWMVSNLRGSLFRRKTTWRTWHDQIRFSRFFVQFYRKNCPFDR